LLHRSRRRRAGLKGAISASHRELSRRMHSVAKTTIGWRLREGTETGMRGADAVTPLSGRAPARDDARLKAQSGSIRLAGKIPRRGRDSIRPAMPWCTSPGPIELLSPYPPRPVPSVGDFIGSGSSSRPHPRRTTVVRRRRIHLARGKSIDCGPSRFAVESHRRQALRRQPPGNALAAILACLFPT